MNLGKMSFISSELGVLKANHFNEGYFDLFLSLCKEGSAIPSRNGNTQEFLNFKTILTSPVKRCVGGLNRNINVFSLLAEALWIWAGRKDVAFLDPFNSNLKNYSDDGVTYHAPYGYRMRNYGAQVDDVVKLDQIKVALGMLSKNEDDRRVVISIWNPHQDLGTNSKDIPCNDLWMLKIRDSKLYTTIQNRSNDLNWGLTTNVFQFSFIGEIMSSILGVGLGEQVHNSQSLHIYSDNELTLAMRKEVFDLKVGDIAKEKTLLYDIAHPLYMDFAFPTSDWRDRVDIIDFHISNIIRILEREAIQKPHEYDVNSYLESLKNFSSYYYIIYRILSIYLEYKNNTNKEKKRVFAIYKLKDLAKEMPQFGISDYMILALNFFITRIKDEEERSAVNALLTPFFIPLLGKL